jgi:hypothetical protein
VGSFGHPKAVALGLMLALSMPAAAAPSAYPSPDAAVSALVDALRTDNNAALQAILGPGSGKLISSGDPREDAEARRRFLDAFAAHHGLEEDGPDRRRLVVGDKDWPLPIPLVRGGAGWRFDGRAGVQELIDRRIGRNELAAIDMALSYVEAQRDYFARGAGEYAQRLISSPGSKDGLYWPAATGEPESPFGPLVSQAIEEGFEGQPVSGQPVVYRGYQFRILKEQGDSAPGGTKSYVVDGRMTGGFALLAAPVKYGASGIMTFIVGPDGVVFQKDLGPNTTRAAAELGRYDPDLSWARVDITN